MAALDNVASAGTHIAYDLPDSVLGAVALSPVIPVITFPDGSEFRCDVNKEEGGISCIPDNNDPPGPKLLIIPNPPTGDYEITLETVGGGGEYHFITSLANANGDHVASAAGMATPGKNNGYEFIVGPDAKELRLEKVDVEDLLNQIKQLAQAAKKANDFSGRQQGAVIKSVHNALKDLRAYEKRTAKEKGPTAAASSLESYYDNLEKIEQEAQNAGVSEIIILIEKIRRFSPAV